MGPRHRHCLASMLLAAAVLTSACNDASVSVGADAGDATPAITPGPGDAPGPEDEPAPQTQQHPDIIEARLTRSGDSWSLDATISSPYDTPERYADAFRAVGPDGTVLGVRELTHDHANEQPFTRTLTNLVIPAGTRQVTVEARDLQFGWGGATVTLDVPADPEPTPTQETAGEVVITEDDSGRAVAFDDHTQATLRLRPSAGQWSEPKVAGTSIQLAERMFLVDPGYREWEILVAGPGSSTISSASDPCPGAEDPPCGAPSRLFEVTIDVA